MLPLLALAGCVPFGHKPTVTVQPPSPAATREHPARPAAPVLPLSRIIGEQLEHGRYAEGERSLRSYLREHPDNRLAESLLHQLMVDPRRQLGPPARTHVVASGDSYSTLAQRYLGDAQLFLLLARYNDATDPALLRVGQSVRLPASAPKAPRGAPPPETADAPAAAARPPAPAAGRLAAQSVALYKQGKHQQALSRMDEALAADPSLSLQAPEARALRDQLVGAYHQRAIVLYRDQQLAQAITLWDHVLAIDPGYEPAIVYRARARELQRRLQQLVK